MSHRIAAGRLICGCFIWEEGMFCRIMISLSGDEADALLQLARSEMRDPREQVRFIVRHDLIQRGFLKPDTSQEPKADPGDCEESAT